MSLNRRDFLEFLGLGAAASVVVHKAEQLPAVDPQEPAVAYRTNVERAFCCSATVDIDGSISYYSLRNGNVEFTADGYPAVSVSLEGSL